MSLAIQPESGEVSFFPSTEQLSDVSGLLFFFFIGSFDNDRRRRKFNYDHVVGDDSPG